MRNPFTVTIRKDRIILGTPRDPVELDDQQALELATELTAATTILLRAADARERLRVLRGGK